MKPDDLIGRLIGGRYQIAELIGRGGYGAVYRATHRQIDRPVAIKVCLHARPALHARFVREARLQARLRHPGCVTLLDFGEEADGSFYMVQEFIDGHTLSEEVSRGPLSPTRALAITRQLLDALHAAHSLGIVHRDIKPSNVMIARGIDGSEEVRLLDFGIAKVFDQPGEAPLTKTGAPIGTPAFMAPEQIRQEEVGPRTDIYAVGAMLYCLCAGSPPFVADRRLDVLRMHLVTPPPALPGHALALDELIARAMAKAPADRFSSAQEMLAAIDALDGTDDRDPLATDDTSVDEVMHLELVLSVGTSQEITSPRSAPGSAADGPRPPADSPAGCETISPNRPLPPPPPVPPDDIAAAEWLNPKQPRRAPPHGRRRLALHALSGIAATALAGMMVYVIASHARDDSAPARLLDQGSVAAAPVALDPGSIAAAPVALDPGSIDAALAADAAVMDATVGDAPAQSIDAAADAELAPASPPRPRPGERLMGTIERHLSACRCDDVPPLLHRLERIDRRDAARAHSRYMERCFVLTAGSCTSSARLPPPR